MSDSAPAQTAGTTPIMTSGERKIRETVAGGIREGFVWDKYETADLEALLKEFDRLRAENERLTKDREALCVCGHVHETVTLDGHASVFHRCRDKACSCNEFRSGSNKFERSKEWWMAKAEAEGDFVIGAGSASRSGAGTTLSDEEQALVEWLRTEADENRFNADLFRNDDHPLSGQAIEDYDKRAQRYADVVTMVDRLSSVAPREESADTQRLDALELFALNGALGFGSTNFGRVEIEDEDDLDSAAFVVNGPKTSWGLRVGHGNTLRTAIDSAMAWQGAKNLNDTESFTPSDPVERREGNTNTEPGHPHEG